MELQQDGYRQERGEFYATPKEVWGFTAPALRGTPETVARRFLEANAALFDFEPGLAGLRNRRIISSLGAHHVILSQVHDGQRVHRGYVTVHMDLQRRVYLVKNRSVPARLLPDAFVERISREEAVRRARHALPRRKHDAVLRETARLWFPRKDALLPAWKVRLTRTQPHEEWILYVNARTGTILNRFDNMAQAVIGRGRVFDPNPVTALGGHAALLTATNHPRHPPPEAYREVRLEGLCDCGVLSGEKVTTGPTRHRVRRPDHRYLFEAQQAGFEEVMVYHHVDSAVRYLEDLGYRDRHVIFRKPVRANVRGSRDDNSFYSPVDRMLIFGTGQIDDAEDGETILHEFGHAIQDAICPDFGQSTQASAMGEGFGDYFAASFFEDRKPARYRNTVMSWDGLLYGMGQGSDPPCVRRVDEPVTAADFEEKGDEHDNGLIWSATLWDVRRALGQALGPESGRRAADRLIVESHFQQDGFTTFARGARAILDADGNLEQGRNRQALLRIFRKRGIGPL